MKVFTVMKLGIAIAFVFVGINWTNSLHQGSAFRSIEFITKIPAGFQKVGNKQQPIYVSDTIGICYFNKYRIYKLAEFSNGERVECVTLFFVCMEGESHGLLYRSLDDNATHQRLSSDSFISARGVKDIDIIVNDPWKLVSTIKDQRSGQILDKYYAPSPPGPFMIDSIYLYYTTKLNVQEFSLSKKQDSLKGSKLQKISFFFTPYFSAVENDSIPRTEASTEIRNYIEPNQKEILKMINRFNKEITTSR